MSRISVLIAIASLAFGVPPAFGDGPARDFKLHFGYYGVEKEPLVRGEIDVRGNRIYQFLDGAPEVVIIDRTRKAVRLLDLARKLQTELTFAKIEEGVEAIRVELRESIAHLEKSPERADRIEAAMDRDKLDSKLAVAVDDASGRVTLKNPSIEVTATGAAEPDADRLASVRDALVVGVKLNAIREPDNLPPFAHLATLSALLDDRKQRPAEMTFLFRLAGPPQKFRWTYALDPALTDRDVEALDRIDALLKTTRAVDFDRYERLIVPLRQP